MKDLFSKENFLFTNFDKGQRRQSVIVAIIMMVLFVAAAFCFMNMLYCFADMVGSIVSASADVAVKDLLRSVPIFLSFFMTLWTLLMAHAFFRNVDPERRARSLKKDAIAILAFAGANILYVIVGLIMGKYSSIVEGSPSPWFPLDSVLYSLLFVAIGVLALVFGGKLNANYVVPSRGPIVKKARFGYCLAITLWMLVALFCFAGFFIGLFIIDFLHGYVAYSIGLLLVYFINAVFFIVWEFFYNELNEEARAKFLRRIGITGLIVSVVVADYYFTALGFNLDGPANVGFGVLPVAFAASVNIATMVVVATPIIVSVVALVKGIRIRRQIKKQEN